MSFDFATTDGGHTRSNLRVQRVGKEDVINKESIKKQVTLKHENSMRDIQKS